MACSCCRRHVEGAACSACKDDELVRAIGCCGRWQLRTCLLLMVVSFSGSWHILAINFQAPPARFWCATTITDTATTAATITAATTATSTTTNQDQCFQHSFNTRNSQEYWRQTSTADNKTKYLRPRATEPLRPRATESRMYQPLNQLPFTVNRTSIGWKNSEEHVGEQKMLKISSTRACTRWIFDVNQYSSNIVSEFGLVCHRAWIHKLSQSVYMTGVMVGVIPWGAAADRYGRRPVMLCCYGIMFVFALANTTSMSAPMFLILRFLTAFCEFGAYMASFTTAMELVGPALRSYLGVFFNVPASLGFMSLSMICYFVRDWRAIQLIISLPSLFYVGYYWLIPESPRWLYSVGRDDEADKIVNIICLHNGTRPPDKVLLKKDAPNEEKKDRFIDLFLNRRMLVYVLALQYIWFVVGMVFYGILLNTEDFGTNIYLNAVLAGVVELPAYLVCALALRTLGRRISIMVTMLGAGVSCLLTLVFRKGDYPYDWPIVVLAMSGKFCVSAAFGAIYTFSSEMFPTTLRNSALALCSVMARLGSILAPFMFFASDVTTQSAPIVVFGCLALVASVVVLLLPETTNQRLAATIADVVQNKTKQQTDHAAKQCCKEDMKV